MTHPLDAAGPIEPGSTPFPRLFSPLPRPRSLQVRNRIFSSGHDTGDGQAGTGVRAADRVSAGAGRRRRGADRGPGGGRPPDRGVHVARPGCLGRRVHPRLPTAGRGGPRGGRGHLRPALPRRARGAALARRPSARSPISSSPTPNERFHIMPREMPVALIADVIAAYWACGPRGLACGGLATTVSRSLRARATCPPSSSARGSTGVRTATAATCRTASASCAMSARRPAPALGDDRPGAGHAHLRRRAFGPEGLQPDETLEIIAALIRRRAVGTTSTSSPAPRPPWVAPFTSCRR